MTNISSRHISILIYTLINAVLPTLITILVVHGRSDEEVSKFIAWFSWISVAIMMSSLTNGIFVLRELAHAVDINERLYSLLVISFLISIASCLIVIAFFRTEWYNYPATFFAILIPSFDIIIKSYYFVKGDLKRINQMNIFATAVVVAIYFTVLNRTGINGYFEYLCIVTSQLAVTLVFASGIRLRISNSNINGLKDIASSMALGVSNLCVQAAHLYVINYILPNENNNLLVYYVSLQIISVTGILPGVIGKFLVIKKTIDSNGNVHKYSMINLISMVPVVIAYLTYKQHFSDNAFFNLDVASGIYLLTVCALIMIILPWGQVLVVRGRNRTVLFLNIVWALVYLVSIKTFGNSVELCLRSLALAYAMLYILSYWVAKK